MHQLKPYVITIVGPESSGKTTLARELAAKFGCPWVPEYAREFLERLGRPYEQEDLVTIAEGQWEAINRQLAVFSQQSPMDIPPSAPGEGWATASEAGFKKAGLGAAYLTFETETTREKERPVLIVDSGLMSLRVWARLKYGLTLPFVEELLANDLTCLYILCRPLYPWVPDPLRESPSLLDRAWIYNHYLKEISAIPQR